MPNRSIRSLLIFALAVLQLISIGCRRGSGSGELVMMIEKDYAVTIDNRELGEKALASVRALAGHIRANSPRWVG